MIGWRAVHRPCTCEGIESVQALQEAEAKLDDDEYANHLLVEANVD